MTLGDTCDDYFNEKNAQGTSWHAATIVLLSNREHEERLPMETEFEQALGGVSV